MSLNGGLGEVVLLNQLLDSSIYAECVEIVPISGTQDYWLMTRDTALGMAVIKATYSLQIYDRWGGLLYNSKDIDDGWDGLHPESGELVPTGVYAYVVKARSKSGRYILEAGEVHLLH